MTQLLNVDIDTVESLATAESGRQTSEPANSQRNFTWGGGIHWSSVLRIIHHYLYLKCCKERCTRSTADWSAQHARGL